MGVGRNGEGAFADAVRRRLDDLRRSQRWLGEQVAQVEGRGQPYAQATVAGWLGENPPEPPVVFAIEQALDCKPGMLSRLLGYLPVEAKPARSVPEAIDLDPVLNDQARRMLRSLYRSAVSD